MVTGKTINLGVMGWPIAHSLSPAMQQGAIASAGVDYSYIALPVRPEDLQAAVAGLRAMHFRGWNVTIPHKQAIMSLLDEIDEDAKAIGAVNTVVNDEGCLLGCNTDVLGFLAPLRERRIGLSGRQAVVLGAGGAARAVLWGLVKSGVEKITLVLRSPAKARPMADSFAMWPGNSKLAVCAFHDDAYAEALSQADILVNTTPLGMAPKVEEAPPVEWERVKPEAFVYDIIYTPAETKFLSEAKSHGHRVQNGEQMLVGQGAAAFEKWTGRTADTVRMQEELHRQLLKK